MQKMFRKSMLIIGYFIANLGELDNQKVVAFHRKTNLILLICLMELDLLHETLSV